MQTDTTQQSNTQQTTGYTGPAITTAQFANAIRSQYPGAVASDGRAYKDIPDQELTQKALQNPKYAVYQGHISDLNSQTQTPDNSSFADKTINTVKDLAKGFVKSVGNTANNLNNMASPVMNAIDKPLEAVAGTIQGVSPQGQQNVINSQQADVAGDMATRENLAQTHNIAQDIGKGIGNVAQFAMTPETSEMSAIPRIATNAVIGASTAGAQGQNPIVGGIANAILPEAGNIVKGVGNMIKGAGSEAVSSVIPVDMQEAGAEQAYKATTPVWKRFTNMLQGIDNAPQSAGDTVAEKGLVGTKGMLGVQATKAANTLWNKTVEPALQGGKDVNLSDIFDGVENQIIGTTADVSRQNALLDALQAVKDEYANAGKETIPLKELQSIKEDWAQFVPQKFYKGQDISGATNQVNALLANEARQTIYGQLGDKVKQAYIDYGNLKGIQELGKVAMTGQKLKGGSGSLVSELLSQTLTPIMTLGGQAVYKTGQGIEFMGAKGMKTLGDLFGNKVVTGAVQQGLQSLTGNPPASQ